MSLRNYWPAVAISFLAVLPASADPPKRSQLVPPTLEIAVLDPNADPMGRPAIKLNKRDDGRTEVEIPETVLVHRFYYTGDRTFQAQMLPGGPCIVVANHPKCGERLYIPVQMLPGAPRVHYTSRSIEYDFGKEGITIHFCTLFGSPKVE